jgi:glycosyltransferase involved in cell wall biosynthesis
VPVDARPWRSDSAIEDIRGFDVGLMPLDDTPFERAKFPFKLLQYLALGVPAVASRAGVATSVIRDGENGLLAGSPGEWHDALERLIGDHALRQRLVSAGRDTVIANFTLERVGPLLLDVLVHAAPQSSRHRIRP